MRHMTKAAAAALALALLSLPATASAYTTDAWGRSYSGQDACAACHNGIAASDRSSYLNTVHSNMVKDVRSDPSALVPVSTSTVQWPSPGFGLTGLRFGASNVYLITGGGPVKEYVGVPGESLPAQSPVATVPLASGSPSDDLTIFDGANYNAGEAAWELEGPTGTRAYIQGCGGCHNLGVTRPGSATTTLANGAVMSPSTPTRITGLSIQCEVCHGTGSVTTKHNSLYPAVLAWESSSAAPSRLLSAEVCGQCHADGQAKETNYGGSRKFSSPNGYSADETLSAYMTHTSLVPSEAAYLANPSGYKFFPNGAVRSIKHSLYNEWLQNKNANGYGHIKPMPTTVAKNATSFKCLRCHSGEGFLENIGDPIVPATYNVSTQTVKWGITCQVCHNVHDPVYGLALRRSTLATVGVVDCGDCHNWQYEVMGLAIPTKAEYDAGGAYRRPSHPMREMLAGAGMFGVPAAGEFMPDVECADCHMPNTSSSNELPSHRFKPMLPGEAEEWGVKEGGDSCTPCHPSTSRADLQAEIDEWQTATDDLRVETSAAMRATRVRMGWPLAEGTLSSTTTADPDISAYKLALHNRNFVENDSSLGAHNPPYAAAGLEWARDVARSIGGTVSISAPATAPVSSMVTVFGVVTQGDGSFVAGEEVLVQARAVGGGGFSTIATAATNGFGSYIVTYTLTADTELRAIWRAPSRDMTTGVRTVRAGSWSTGATPVGRIRGSNIYGTAVAASKAVFFADSVPNIVMASASAYADGLAASGLAGVAGSPLMLTSATDVPTSVMNEIARISPAPSATTVWIVGGTATVGGGVVRELQAAGYTVRRLGGATRYHTAVLVANKVAEIAGVGFTHKAFLVSGTNYADALSVGPVVYSSGRPVLLTTATYLHPASATAISRLGITNVSVVGGTASVGGAVLRALPAGSSRVASGADRYVTSGRFAAWAIDAAALCTPSYVGLAGGTSPSEALVAAPVVGSNGGVLLLTPASTLSSSARGFLTTRRAAIDRAMLFGGPGTIGDVVFAQVYQALNP